MQPAGLGAWALFFVTFAPLGILVLAPPSSAQAIESSQQTNDRIRALSATARSAPPHDYVIGNGDVLAVEVFDVPELSRDLRVSQTGTIRLPLVPVRLHVSGLTEIQTAAKISEVLQANGLVSHPEVNVNVKEKKNKPITVVGAVGHPMVYQADRQITLIEVLAEAGGIANDAGDTVIISRPEPNFTNDPSEPSLLGPEDAGPAASVKKSSVPPSNASSDSKDTSSVPSHTSPSASSAVTPPAAVEPPKIDPPNTSIITVNLAEILERGNTSNNIVLQAGDVVTVPHAGIIYALGAVSRPGGFVVSNDRAQLTTLKLLSLAGGLERVAKSDHAVIVRRDINGQQREVAVDLKKIMQFQAEDVRLQPSDILYVPKSAAKQTVIKTVELATAIATGVIIYRAVYH
jgi:polysaccharide export outer membrane protein